MIWDGIGSLRLEQHGGRLVLREAGWPTALIRALIGVPIAAAGCLVASIILGGLAQGLFLPAPPAPWYMWIAWVIFLLLFPGVMGIGLAGLGIALVAHRWRFTIDQPNDTVTFWRGLYGLPLLRRTYRLRSFREVTIRPHPRHGKGGTWYRWAVALEGENRLKLASVEETQKAEATAAQVGRATGLPVRRHNDSR